MRFVLWILLLAVRSGQASETSKGWSDWLSEGKALRAADTFVILVSSQKHAEEMRNISSTRRSEAH